MTTFENWLSQVFWGTTVKNYLIAGGVFVGILVVIRLVKFFVIRYLRKLVKKTANDIDDLVIEIIDTFTWPFQVLVALVVAVEWLNLSATLDKVFDYALLIGLTIYVVLALQKALDYMIKKLIAKKTDSDKEFDTSVVRVMGRIGKVTIWLVAGLIVLQNVGFDVSTLVVGMGVGGIAIAFALQGILTDLFAYFSIYFDKPFKAGDFIVFGKKSGTVHRIGLKSTRIKTLQGEELVVSNQELIGAKVHNYKLMEKRRVSVDLGFTYDTSSAKMKQVPRIIKEIVEETELAGFQRCHFKEFGESALIFEVVYEVDTSDYDKYMDVQQEINLQIKEKMDAAQIEFAYPTYSVLVNESS